MVTLVVIILQCMAVISAGVSVISPMSPLSRVPQFTELPMDELSRYYYPYELCLLKHKKNTTYCNSFKRVVHASLPPFHESCSLVGRVNFIVSTANVYYMCSNLLCTEYVVNYYHCYDVVEYPNITKFKSLSERQGFRSGWSENVTPRRYASLFVQSLLAEGISSLVFWGDSILRGFNRFLLCDLYRQGMTSIGSKELDSVKINEDSHMTFFFHQGPYRGVNFSVHYYLTLGDFLIQYEKIPQLFSDVLSTVSTKSTGLKVKQTAAIGTTVVLCNTGLHLHTAKEINLIPTILHQLHKSTNRELEVNQKDMLFFFTDTIAQAFARKNCGMFHGTATTAKGNVCGTPRSCTLNKVSAYWQVVNDRFDLAFQALQRDESTANITIGRIPIFESTTYFGDMRLERIDDCTHIKYSPLANDRIWQVIHQSICHQIKILGGHKDHHSEFGCHHNS